MSFKALLVTVILVETVFSIHAAVIGNNARGMYTSKKIAFILIFLYEILNFSLLWKLFEILENA